MSSGAALVDIVIVIVGAGAVGLGALRRLSGTPVKVWVLEVWHQRGGRAWTVRHNRNSRVERVG